MKLPPALSLVVVFLFLCLPSRVRGDAAPFASLPSCALPCLATAIQNSPCEATDQTCLCTDKNLLSDATNCVLTGCSIREALVTENITMTFCQAPVRNKGLRFRIASSTLASIATTFVILRVFDKVLVSKSGLGWDDWAALVTIIVDFPNTILCVVTLVNNGLGRDIWTLTPEQITAFLRAFYITEVLYLFCVASLKLAVALFYMRIFPAKKIQILLKGTVVVTVLFGIAFIFAGIFQCRPVNFYWAGWEEMGAVDGKWTWKSRYGTGTCANVNPVAWSNGAISIALDLWVLALPLSQLRKLNLKWKKKVQVGIMFCVGTLFTIISIIRLASLINFSKSTNTSWDLFDVCLWSAMELHTGVICICLPSLRVTLVRIFPKLRDSSLSMSRRKQSQSYYPAGGSGDGTFASAGAGRHSRRYTNPNSRPDLGVVGGKEGGKEGGGGAGVYTSSGIPPDMKGILCETTYAVEYGDVEDIIEEEEEEEEEEGNGHSHVHVHSHAHPHPHPHIHAEEVPLDVLDHHHYRHHHHHHHQEGCTSAPVSTSMSRSTSL